MPQIIAGPGQPLPLEYNYPQSLFNTPFTQRGNEISIAPGESWVFPATGTYGWWLEGGTYSVLQYQDPITQTWRGFSSVRRGPLRIVSDGFNWRIANLTGCPVAAVVTGSSTGFTQAGTSVAASAGGSLWYPVIGGTLTVTVINAGVGYGLPPFVVIDPPQQQGVQATAYATITSGTVATIVVDNMGAGYLSAPKVQIVPNPYDPNYIAGSITTNATAGAALISANQGKVTAVLNTNPGAPQAAAAVPTLTVSGGGTASVSAVMMSSITGVTITGAGTTVSANNELISVGGRTTYVPAFTNPAIELTGYIPRPAQFLMAVAGGTVASISQTYDSGLFTGTPNLLLLSQSALGTTPTITAAMGGVDDMFVLQPT